MLFVSSRGPGKDGPLVGMVLLGLAAGEIQTRRRARAVLPKKPRGPDFSRGTGRSADERQDRSRAGVTLTDDVNQEHTP